MTKNGRLSNKTDGPGAERNFYIKTWVFRETRQSLGKIVRWEYAFVHLGNKLILYIMFNWKYIAKRSDRRCQLLFQSAVYNLSTVHFILCWINWNLLQVFVLIWYRAWCIQINLLQLFHEQIRSYLNDTFKRIFSIKIERYWKVERSFEWKF